MSERPTAGGALGDQIDGDDARSAVTIAPARDLEVAEARRVVRRARRVLGAALGRRVLDPDLLAAASLVVEVGGRDD